MAIKAGDEALPEALYGLIDTFALWRAGTLCERYGRRRSVPEETLATALGGHPPASRVPNLPGQYT